MEVGGLNKFSRTSSDVGVDPNYYDGLLGVFCCEIACNGGDVL